MDAAQTVLYIGAHDVDFLVRAGGTLARYTRGGNRVVTVSLTFGEHQESDRLWQERPGITVDEVKSIRKAESMACAELIGCESRFLDWGDCPITFSAERLWELASIVQEIRPSVLITHWPQEVTNWDHMHTAQAVREAVQYAAAWGTSVHTGMPPWTEAEIYYSEPTFPFPDRNGFAPNVWVDITDEYSTKLEGLRTAWSHGRLDLSYPLCAEFRAYQARLLSGDESIMQAEAFVFDGAFVGRALPATRLSA